MRIPEPAFDRIVHGHSTLRQVMENLSEDLWGSYFKFAIVRNPYDRFVYVFAFLNRRNPSYVGNETAFMMRAMQRHRFRQRVLVRPQVEMLIDDDGRDGRLGLDYIGRYETLEDSLAEACRLAGLPKLNLPRVNASRHADYKTYYQSELLNTVTSFYSRDFDLLGYSKKVIATDPSR